ncbi:hypothetical protein RFI_11003 [Reticulomyxa filosa]|uniref:Uncharacterized protein n=1 Tax=Reticulomyxa filosa TaxID=46433 RepID=X6NK74_RETFI|nr:hypothetical protein RFI_11003 [Reticulomyxa filosa]|eukprot:ETO26134.1 hypothetical protein RFI_11003 [Reticulomyxa filosa]
MYVAVAIYLHSNSPLFFYFILNKRKNTMTIFELEKVVSLQWCQKWIEFIGENKDDPSPKKGKKRAKRNSSSPDEDGDEEMANVEKSHEDNVEDEKERVENESEELNSENERNEEDENNLEQAITHLASFEVGICRTKCSCYVIEQHCKQQTNKQ